MKGMALTISLTLASWVGFAGASLDNAGHSTAATVLCCAFGAIAGIAGALTTKPTRHARKPGGGE